MIQNIKHKLLMVLVAICLWAFLAYSIVFLTATQSVCLFSLSEEFEFMHTKNLKIVNIFANQCVEPASVNVFSNIAPKPLINNFNDYSSLEKIFEFKYPSSFMLQLESFGGNEILYHINFKDKANIVHGFIQVWNMPQPLKNFLEVSKSNANIELQNFMQKNVTINNVAGYLWDYNFISNEGINYKAMEVFLSKNNKMYRISYFLPIKDWNSKQQDIFWKMVNSFKIKS